MANGFFCKNAVAQIAISGVNSKFTENAKNYNAITEEFDLGVYKTNKSFVVNYHSVIFDNLNQIQYMHTELEMEKIGQNGFNLKLHKPVTVLLNLFILGMHKMIY